MHSKEPVILEIQMISFEKDSFINKDLCINAYCEELNMWTNGLTSPVNI